MQMLRHQEAPNTVRSRC